MTWTTRVGLLRAIRSGEHEYLLTWQRFYPMQTDILEALAESGIKTVFLDFGFYPHYESVVFDPDGEGARSALRKHWSSAPAPAPADDDEFLHAKALLEEHALRSLEVAGLDFRERKIIRQPFLFLPLQRPMDSTVHDFRALVLKIVTTAARDLFIVVKAHPLDRDVELGVPDQIPGRLLVLRRGFHRDSESLNDWLLSQAAVVVGINSNMLFRAILFNRPVISLGEGWFSGSGALSEVRGLDGLHDIECRPVVQRKRLAFVEECLCRQVLIRELDRPERIDQVMSRIGVACMRETDSPQVVVA